MKWGQFETLTGKKGNVFNVSSWVEMVLGAFVMLVTFALGQSLYQKVGARVPVGGDKIERIVNDQNTSANQTIVL